MEIEYATEKLALQCNNKQAALKLFGGDESLAIKLLSRINALENADTIKDIIVQRPFRFHALNAKNKRNLKGYFAIDVKNKTSPWRIILQPLTENKKPFNPCKIDEIAHKVRIIEIKEVSKHYE